MKKIILKTGDTVKIISLPISIGIDLIGKIGKITFIYGEEIKDLRIQVDVSDGESVNNIWYFNNENLKLINSKNKNMKTIKDFSTEQLKKELAKRGYQTDNLWQVSDVDTALDRVNEMRDRNYEEPIILAPNDRYSIMAQVMKSDGIMDAIQSALFDFIEEEYSINPEPNYGFEPKVAPKGMN